MNFINPSVELIKQEDNTLAGIFRHIERCGRTCYKSEDKITKDSAEKFVNRLIANGHTAMLEHGTVYATVDINYKTNKIVGFEENNTLLFWIELIFSKNPYTSIVCTFKGDIKTYYITTNYRVVYENKAEDIIKPFITEPTKHIRRFSLKFSTNIGVTREGNRHRVNSIAEESTRYCNYSKNKFGKQITYCVPNWELKSSNADNKEIPFYINDLDNDDFIRNVLFNSNNKEFDSIYYYLIALRVAEICYTKLIEKGWTAQQAREVLPLATKSDVVYTANAKQFKHFFDLRYYGKTGAPHPNIYAIALKAKKVLEQNDLWKYIDAE